jgi:hypothetical protein
MKCKRRRLNLGLRGGGCFDDGYCLGPFYGDHIPLFHGQAGIMDKHLWAFAAAPREKAQEMFLADALCAGGGVDFGSTTLDQAIQFVHGVPRSAYSMQDRRSDFQPALSPSD